MRALGANLGLAAVVGWVGFALAGLVLGPTGASVLGCLIGVVCVTALRATLPVRALMALLAPFGVVLPALALRHAAVGIGLPIPGLSSLELAVFLVAYVAFLAAAFGLFSTDIYRFGYSPTPVVCMVLGVCAYSLVTGNWFLAGIAVAGQLAWAMKWGSSNWFDHVLHVVLVPVVALSLLARMF